MAFAFSIDGVMTSEADAKVSVLDRGFLYGDSAFEVLRTYEGVPFLVERHLERLERSCAALSIAFPGDAETWTREIAAVVSAVRPAEAYLRLTVTRGEGPLGLDPRPAKTPRRIVWAAPLPAFPEALRSAGATAELKGFSGSLLGPSRAEAKVSNYLLNVLATGEARAKGLHEVIFVGPGGEIFEGASSNVFAVRGRIVSTPPIELGILPGITRGLVLDLARDAGLTLRETILTPRDLYGADELFITSSLREIVPLVALDGQPVGDGRPGPIAGQLHALYTARVRSVG